MAWSTGSVPAVLPSRARSVTVPSLTSCKACVARSTAATCLVADDEHKVELLQLGLPDLPAPR